MLQRLLLTMALLGGALPALAQSQQQGTPEDRAACAPAVQKYCKSANEDPMRVLACLQANRAKIGDVCNKVLVGNTSKIFFGTINHVSRWMSELGRSTFPPLDCQGFKAPLSPRAGLYFLEPTARQAGWRNQTSSSQISIHLSDLRHVR